MRVPQFLKNLRYPQISDQNLMDLSFEISSIIHTAYMLIGDDQVNSHLETI